MSTGMIVTTTKLQREISQLGLEFLKKLAVDTSGNLTRMDVSPAAADAVVGTVQYVKGEIDQVPTQEQGNVSIEIRPSAGRIWRTALRTWIRRATKLDKNAQQLTLATNVNDREDAALKLINQLNEQMELPIESLESIVAGEEKRQAAEDEALADGTSPAPHRGRRKHGNEPGEYQPPAA